jgi:hypothetical protein
MAPLASVYTKFQEKTDDYTLGASDDVVDFTIATAKTATLPLAKTCTVNNTWFKKVITNKSTSSDTLTIAVQSGNSLVGLTSLGVGEQAILSSNGATIWTARGGTGATGTSGFSGFSAYSGFSGASGYSGFTGTSGYSGYTGVSGYSGKSGYSGVSGYSGYSGVSGYSGFSGFSGFSGYTGV